MQLTNFEQVRPWAPLIKYRVENREMPPYAYYHCIGIQELQGDWRLEQSEIDTIVAWVEQGAPEGDWGDRSHPVADLPAADEWTFAAQFGAPSLILDSAPIDVPALGNDMWHRPYVMTGLTTDRCIKAIQVKPAGGAKAVVHHANSNVEVMNEDGEYEDYGMFTEYAMGKWGEIAPEGVCRTLPANARIRWDIHLFPGGVGATAPGTMIEDNVVEIGVWLHPEGFAETAKYKQVAVWLEAVDTHRVVERVEALSHGSAIRRNNKLAGVQSVQLQILLVFGHFLEAFRVQPYADFNNVVFNDGARSSCAYTTWEEVNVPANTCIGWQCAANAFRRDLAPLAHRVLSEHTVVFVLACFLIHDFHV